MKKFVVSALFSLLFPLFCSGTTTSAVFAKYPNPVFVETGTYNGDGIQMALEANFSTIYSMELSPFFYAKAQKRFARQPRVKIVKGNSETKLYALIINIHKPITFWLDAHYSGGEKIPGAKNTPILDELDQIKKHPIKTHTILIDDMRCCNTWWFDGISKQQIIDKVKEINPHYVITFDEGYIPNDVLVARVPKRVHSG